MTHAAPAPVKIAIAGALGRMGRAVAATCEERDDVTVVARYERPGVEGEGLVSLDEALGLADAVIDFTTPEASVALAEKAAGRGGVALVIGSTGLSQDQTRRIDEAATRIAIVRAGNFSLGVNLLMGMVRQAAAALDPRDFDIEIFEAHHRRKVDSPSGTALMLGEAAADGRGVALADVLQPARHGLNGPRPEGEIGFSVLRGGGIIGEHSVTFASEEEILTFSHSARDRGLFARGALAAAKWAAGRKSGAFDMQDVLGLGG
ncbi:MAG: 4-hydroxy-tetrahydrodipicolinate reductase [Caulobacter sp.]|nr:4-hydroxy-tetrahydrodipicolinate reductase [Caulobacter sp.]